ncbi:MAG: hypothetical protein A2144_14530 [Chloroflexi bacterium RBG_16_50_9]|nr:MAG: hypothetical protein A2144_14530 [Chloroflexi bacterium RBG_16_50_9]
MKKIAIEEHVTEGGLDHLEQRLKDMDESGIDMQVLNFVLLFDERISAAAATEKARITNDALAKTVEKYPERFASFASLALQNPDAAANELERAVKKLGLKGTMLYLPIKDNLDNQKYWVLFERAEKLGVQYIFIPAPLQPIPFKPIQATLY